MTTADVNRLYVQAEETGPAEYKVEIRGNDPLAAEAIIAELRRQVLPDSTSEGGRERVLSRLQRADNMLGAVLANHPESNFVDDRVRESRREIRSVLAALDGRE